MVQGSFTSSQVKRLLGLHMELFSPEKSRSQEMGSEWRNRPREKLPAGDGFAAEPSRPAPGGTLPDPFPLHLAGLHR